MRVRGRGFVGVGAVLAAIVVGCGGGGGDKGSSTTSGGSTDPAPEPTCSTAVVRSSDLSSQAAAQDPRLYVPPSSRERDEDVGERLHTNHIVLRGAGRGNGPAGLVPEQVRNAYTVPANAGSGAIAIVVAYHYNAAVSDFNVFSSEFELPTEPSGDPTASTNGQLQIVYASGAQPATNADWNQEAALDIQWAHAMAPNAKIYLVEADSTRLSDLMEAANVAKALPGVRQVSMSFGGTETSCEYATYDRVLSQPNVAFFAPTGDTSGERLYPGLSRNVISVGGTTLRVNGAGARLSETVWSDTGGGISRYSPRPGFQNPVLDIVGRYRGGADVSAVADPETGVSVYCSVAAGGDVDWIVIGGTSASCPIIAGIANAAGRSGDTAALAARLYAARGSSALYDITQGASGSLEAGPGYDLASGIGSPNGLGAF